MTKEPTPQTAFQRMLHEKLAEIRTRNPAFTLRAFARKLGMNSGAVSSILNGKRRVSHRLAERVAETLDLDPQEKMELLRGLRSGSGQPLRYLELSADQFQLISEWHHFAILGLMRTEGFRNSAAWIARRLGIRQVHASSALARMKRMGMLAETPEGTLTRQAPAYRTTDDVPSAALRRSHATNLELAKTSLEKDPIDERDFTALTLAIDPAKLPLAKERIRKFQDELAELLEPEPRKEVYKLCIQLFPLTRKGE